MKILLLGYSEKSQTERNRIQRAFQKRGHDVNYVLWGELIFSFNAKGLSIKRRNGKDLKYYDYIVPRSPSVHWFGQKRGFRTGQLYKHFLLVVDYINEHHKHILNEGVAKELHFYDKMSQYFILAKNGLPVVPSLLYTGRRIPRSVYEKFPYPYIAKALEGSQGRQVFLINDSEKEIPQLLDDYGVGQVMVQRYLPTRYDYRIIVIGDTVIGGIKRTGQEGEFRSNIHRGGTAEKITVNERMEELVLSTARILKADYIGVDIIEYKGKYYILEVNIFAGFEGFEGATNINVAEKLVAYVEQKYLWSLESVVDPKERRRMVEDLYEVEKENFEGPFRKKEFREELRDKHLLIVKKENHPIAYLTYHKSGTVTRVSRYVILQKYIGQRIGRRMLRRVIAISRGEGSNKVQATVPSSYLRRQQSFQRAGFKQVRTKKKHFGPRGDGLVFEYTIKAAKARSPRKPAKKQ
ncbi:MAG: RimK family alpha-L-glutamate ligase [Candidatus Spechtbacterales bacterium]